MDELHPAETTQTAPETISPATIEAAFTPTSETVTGFRAAADVQPIDVVVNRISADLTQFRAGDINFRVKAHYEPRGTLLSVKLSRLDDDSGKNVWAGVRGVLVLDFTTTETLIEIQMGRTAEIFYRDGAVSTLMVKKDFEPFVEKTELEPEEALEKRLEFVSSGFEKAAALDNSDDRKVPAQDRNFHELATLLGIVRPDLRVAVTRAVGKYTKLTGGRLNLGVREHFETSVEKVGAHPLDYWWMSKVHQDQTAVRSTAEPVRFGMRLPKHSPLTRGDKPKTAQERAKLEARVAANRAERDANRPAKGPVGASNNQGHGKGKGKGKGKKK
ncbi:MAG: hypothetical protein Q8R25_01010 [bacterium]|nr:hypothetical protein [bacterium]